MATHSAKWKLKPYTGLDTRQAESLSDMEAKPVVKTLTDTLLQVVAKTGTDTLTCVETEAPVKTESDTGAPLEAYAFIDTEALVYRQPYTFLQLQAESVTDTLTRP